MRITFRLINAKHFTLRGKAGNFKKYMSLEIKPFLNFILSLNQNVRLLVPILSDLAVLIAKRDSPAKSGGYLFRRIDRLYLRLCRITGELGRLDFKKAAPDKLKGFALEDFVFSSIDFSRYREIGEKEFNRLFTEGITDFSEDFFTRNFGLGVKEIQSVIKECYDKAEGVFKLTQENPLILSVMRTLETSLENQPLFTAREIHEEINKLKAFADEGPAFSDMNALYPRLASSLDNAGVTHEDGMTTRLFISSEGDLSATFRPENKPWTRVLIPAALIKISSQTD